MFANWFNPSDKRCLYANEFTYIHPLGANMNRLFSIRAKYHYVHLYLTEATLGPSGVEYGPLVISRQEVAFHRKVEYMCLFD